MVYFVLLHSCVIALDITGKPLKDILGKYKGHLCSFQYLMYFIQK